MQDAVVAAAVAAAVFVIVENIYFLRNWTCYSSVGCWKKAHTYTRSVYVLCSPIEEQRKVNTVDLFDGKNPNIIHSKNNNKKGIHNEKRNVRKMVSLCLVCLIMCFYYILLLLLELHTYSSMHGMYSHVIEIVSLFMYDQQQFWIVFFFFFVPTFQSSQSWQRLLVVGSLQSQFW